MRTIRISKKGARTSIRLGRSVNIDENAGVAGTVSTGDLDSWRFCAPSSANVQLEARHVELCATNA